MITMECKGELLEFDISEQLTIDLNNIQEELATHAAKLAWWTTLVAYKQDELAATKTEVEKRIAKLELSIRADLASGDGKVTENIVKAHLISHDTYVDLQNMIRDVTKELSILKAMAKGFSDRTALMATVGSLHKVEFESTLRSMIHKAKED